MKAHSIVSDSVFYALLIGAGKVSSLQGMVENAWTGRTLQVMARKGT